MGVLIHLWISINPWTSGVYAILTITYVVFNVNIETFEFNRFRGKNEDEIITLTLVFTVKT